METAVATVLNKFSGEQQTAVRDKVSELESKLDAIRKLMEDYHKIQVASMAEAKANTIANTQAIAGFRKDRTETESKIMDRLFEVDRAFSNMKDLIGEVPPTQTPPNPKPYIRDQSGPLGQSGQHLFGAILAPFFPPFFFAFFFFLQFTL